MGEFRRKAMLSMATAALVAGSVAVSGPAHAASSPIEECGGGSYHVIDKQDLGAVATIYLLYNGTTNCVITWKKDAHAGTKTWMMASIAKQNSNGGFTDYKTDSGNYAYYAGPRKVKAPNTCVDWGGGVPVNGVDVSWYSPPSRWHCD
ncbi:hypothetical protein [Nonomuraea deserti]|uniref:hypothetical protein n=1 Tax=Nonomuraea deserti TaxID=1848322 RepID=UPI001C7076B5|nr:hypothetical protein [Nonomuraea deserti]